MARPITDGMLGAPQFAALAQRLEDVLGAGADLRAVRAVAGRLDGVTLTGRVALLRDTLLAELPADWPAFARVVRRALDDERFAGWIIWPVGDAVAARALEDAHPRAFDEGLDLLAALTPRLTSEFSLRPFLAANLGAPSAAHAGGPRMPTSTSADSRARAPGRGSHGRRALAPCSTAPKPRSRSSMPCTKNPCDRVRRSVANHLGDLAKDAPRAGGRHSVPLAPGAGPQHGIGRPPRAASAGQDRAPRRARAAGLRPARPDRSERTAPGHPRRRDRRAVRVRHRGQQPRNTTAQLMVDYLVHYRTARGGTAPKVFKLTTRALQPGETAKLHGARSFAPRSTRRLHPGRHALELQVNGRRFGQTAFDLIDHARN